MVLVAVVGNPTSCMQGKTTKTTPFMTIIIIIIVMATIVKTLPEKSSSSSPCYLAKG